MSDATTTGRWMPAANGEKPGANPAADAFDTVRSAFDSGRTRPVSWRIEQLRAIEELVSDGEGELVRAMAEDFGKPRIEAWATDLAPVVSWAAHARRRVRSWMRPRRSWPGRTNLPGRAWTVAEPLGTVLVISPWNYPVQLALAPVVSAVSAGNTVVLKPSELAPATSAGIARLVRRYLDPEAIAVVEGGAEVATTLLDEPFDHIFFTGSSTIGRIVAAAAAKHLSSVTLELGGKSPAIVAKDANIEIAARRIAWGKLINAGQTCIAPDYVLVDRSVADRFTKALLRSIDQLEGDDPSVTRTRIVDERHLTRLESLLRDSGGEVVRGGEVDRANRWMTPAVIVDPDPSAPLMQDEIFGPILPVLKVNSVAQAVNFIGSRPKPLSLYLFTRSRQVEKAVVEHTSSGGVCINHVLMQILPPELPFGGVGESGTGAYHGQAGFEELSHRKPVLHRSFRPDFRFVYPPLNKRKERILRRVL